MNQAREERKMKSKPIALLSATALLLLVAALCTPVSAQEDTYLFEYKDVFGKLTRAPVPFDHETHADALEEEGCGACHHVYNEDTGTLEYEEGEETTCTDCHGAKKEGSTPGLRQAFHGSCTGCHRALLKEHKSTGPVTCGECHKKK